MASIDTTPVVVAVDFGPGGEALLQFDNRDTQYSEDVNEITDPPPKRRRKNIRDSDKQAKNNQEAKHLTDSFAALANVNISIANPKITSLTTLEGSQDTKFILLDEVNWSDVSRVGPVRLDQGTLELRLSSVDNHDATTFMTIKCRPEPHLCDDLYSILDIAPNGLTSSFNLVKNVQSVSTLKIKHDAGHPTLLLNIRLYWTSGLEPPRIRYTDRFLMKYLLKRPSEVAYSWSPKDFYDNVHIPESCEAGFDLLQNTQLNCELYPFQQRAVQWLLQREGVRLGSDGNIEPYVNASESCAVSYIPCEDALGRTCYVSPVLGDVQTDLQVLQSVYPPLSGGILAEEMGLGKTVELIALISNHQRKMAPLKPEDISKNGLERSHATLIITPPSIIDQWRDEIAEHAPMLNVIKYNGIKNTHLAPAALREDLMVPDIVITTYSVLASEIHYADDIPERNLRHAKLHTARRSPLVEIDWWRVCLDEAQMVESGVSQAAKVARLIPRCHSWAVSGTPLRKDVKDLLGLLLFLNYQPFCQPRVWNRLLSSHREEFKTIFNTIAMRHTKSRVRAEIRLPPQKRIVITMPFNAIEEQNYNHLFQQMCDDCGLGNDGGPLCEDWHPDRYVEKMRGWLSRLRQTCLHPEMGVSNRQALGHRDGPLRTVNEVLEMMIDQNETALRIEERALLLSTVMRGHLYSFGKQSRSALQAYSDALKKSTVMVNECREQLRLENTRVSALRNTTVDLEKTKDSGSEVEKDDVEQSSRIPVSRQRLRSALEVQHVCAFFSATAYYQIKSDPDLTLEGSEEFQALDKKEADLYELAKTVRRELLIDASVKANAMMKRISELRRTKLVKLPIVDRFENIGGIESRKFLEGMNELRTLLNTQSEQVEEWRRKLMDLLVLRLVDQDEGNEMTGEEYELSTQSQDTQYVYIDALRASFADRNHMINGVYSLLIDMEMKGANKLATEGEGHDPELFKALFAERAKLKLPQNSSLSLRGLIAEVRASITAVKWQEGERGSNRAAVEVTILEGELQRLQSVTNSQAKALTGLEKELDIFRAAMNQRLDFYRQLQQISDMVAPLQEGMDEEVDQIKLEIAGEKERKHDEKLSSLRTKQRFLLHLRTSESSGLEEQRYCVICQSSFEIGVLTVCGHQYCKECIDLWWSQQRSCPMCKRKLKLTDFHNITYKPQELRAQEEQTMTVPDDGTASTNTPTKSSIYSTISSIELNSIKSIDLPGSFGTKIDTLCRHLLWLRDSDPGAKSIIFSQYRDFLNVLSQAFDRCRIGHSSISDQYGTSWFKTDPAVECFLLHAKADSSGLNLTNATHVFLCEPLINAALELQAIARVHRIGQKRPTTVWMYLVSDTVEEAIYELSVSRRMAHMQLAGNTPSKPTTSKNLQPSATQSRAATPTPEQEKEVLLDAANSLELQTAPISSLLVSGRSGGEVVPKDDLWHCLFGKARSKEHIAVGQEVDAEMGRGLRRTAAEARRADEEEVV